MTAARHKAVVQRPWRRRTTRLLLPALGAAAVTGTVLGIALSAGRLGAPDGATARIGARTAPSVTMGADPYLVDRTPNLSRSTQRVTLTPKPDVTGHRYMTADLNLWPAPREHGDPLTVLDAGGRVAVTGKSENGFTRILHRGHVRWVNADYLSTDKPEPEPEPSPEGTGTSDAPVVTGAPCASGDSVESGLVADAAALHRAVCAAFPQVTSYGGYRPDGEHADGHAMDIMVADSGTGQAIADWVRAHAAELHVDDVIWAQHIWTTERASEGWRLMPDRGSATANHYDHVHVRVF